MQILSTPHIGILQGPADFILYYKPEYSNDRKLLLFRIAIGTMQSYSIKRSVVIVREIDESVHPKVVQIRSGLFLAEGPERHISLYEW